MGQHVGVMHAPRWQCVQQQWRGECGWRGWQGLGGASRVRSNDRGGNKGAEWEEWQMRAAPLNVYIQVQSHAAC